MANYNELSEMYKRGQRYNPIYQMIAPIMDAYNAPPQEPEDTLSRNMSGNWWSGLTPTNIQAETPVCPTCGRPIY